MCAWKRKVDNGAPELKLLLRRSLWRRVKPGAAVDLFAGNGDMLAAVPADFSPVHAVENDPKKVARLIKTVESRDADRITVHPMDNLEFVRRKLPHITGVACLDFDAYGSPNRLIAEAARNLRLERTLAVAVTDGAPLAIIRGQRIDIADYQPGDNPEPRRGRVSPVIMKNYPAMVRAFWNRLGRELGFEARDFRFVWKKARRILYYGLLIAPR